MVNWYNIKLMGKGDLPKVSTYALTSENRCWKFFDGKRMYTGKVAHKKYMAWNKQFDEKK